tara:strand:- start:636 stop:941 length:306 start_codon:yes stop_codon:yes gene_type:complete
MNNYTKKLQDELNNCQLTPMFEIEVQDQHGDIDYITCNIYFKGNSIVAERDAVSLAEETSKYIASTRLQVYECFCLDENLEALHEAVLQDIEAGDIYEIPQ